MYQTKFVWLIAEASWQIVEVWSAAKFGFEGGGCVQEGDDRDPFAEAEERERRRSQDVKRRLSAAPLPTQPAPQVGTASLASYRPHTHYQLGACCSVPSPWHTTPARHLILSLVVMVVHILSLLFRCYALPAQRQGAPADSDACEGKTAPTVGIVLSIYTYPRQPGPLL